ncbi:MAG: hypothetical protein V3U27_21380 [Candidatus Tectomicrobia bacterium]
MSQYDSAGEMLTFGDASANTITLAPSEPFVVKCELCEKPVKKGDRLLSVVQEVNTNGVILGVQHLSC